PETYLFPVRFWYESASRGFHFLELELECFQRKLEFFKQFRRSWSRKQQFGQRPRNLYDSRDLQSRGCSRTRYPTPFCCRIGCLRFVRRIAKAGGEGLIQDDTAALTPFNRV